MQSLHDLIHFEINKDNNFPSIIINLSNKGKQQQAQIKHV